MKKRLAVIIAIGLLASCNGVRNSNAAGHHRSMLGPQIPAERLLTDLDYMFKFIERTNPNPYLYASRETILAMRSNAVARIKAEAPMDAYDFWEIVSPIVVSLRDQHTSLSFCAPDEEGKKIKIFSPVGFTRIGRDFYLKYGPWSLKGHFGEKIVAINGISPYEILSNISVHQWYMQIGYIEDLNRRNVTDHIDYCKYATIIYSIYGISDELKLTMEAGGSNFMLNMPMYSISEFGIMPTPTIYAKSETVQSLVTNRGYEPYHFSIVSNNIGYLDLNTFDIETAKRFGYVKLIKDAFRELKEKNIPNLVIDITGNGGGSDYVWGALLPYLRPKPFNFNGNSTEPVALSTMQSMFAESALCDSSYDFEWEKYAYKGKVYLLINNGVFSAAVGFSSAMKFYKAATLVGCETGGWATHLGELKRETLPYTGLYIQSSSKYFLALGGDPSPHGVIPDVPVNYFDYDNIGEYWSPDRDNVYSKVLQLIRGR